MAAGLVFAFFGVFTMSTVPLAPLLLIPLFAALFFALWRNRMAEHGSDVLARMAEPVAVRNMAGLLVMPIAATVVYAAFNAADLAIPSHAIVSALTTVASFAMLILSFFKLVSRTRAFIPAQPDLTGSRSRMR
jgi:hypothetical protein